MKQPLKTFTRNHHLEHFRRAYHSGELFMFEGSLCTCNHINGMEGSVWIYPTIPFAEKFKIFPQQETLQHTNIQ